MSRSPLPSRPRLAEHVSPRRHQARNAEVWVLHDQQSGMAYQLGIREWSLLAQADGTRDLEGILAAAERNGTFAAVATFQTFLEALHAQGLLADGVEPRPEAPPAHPSRPLEPLPDFHLLCDGQGSCCRLYATVMFRPREEAVARGLLPQVLEAGDHPERAFAPLSGSVTCGASSVGFVDGRCVYLGRDGQCGLHAAGGPQGKPLGCRTFPALYVDDGQTIRVSPAVECACVLASLGLGSTGEPLVAPGLTNSDELDPGIHLSRLPEEIRITGKRYASREDFVRWGRNVSANANSSDALGVFVALAEVVETWGLDPRATLQALATPGAVEPTSIRRVLLRLLERTRRRLQVDAAWRSDTDLALRAVRWIAKAAERLTLEPSLLERVLFTPPSAAEARSEAFYLRAIVHGHQLVLEDAPLAPALRDRAVRLVLGRAFLFVVGPDELQEEPTLRHPLALVEATLRGHGLLSRDGLL